MPTIKVKRKKKTEDPSQLELWEDYNAYDTEFERVLRKLHRTMVYLIRTNAMKMLPESAKVKVQVKFIRPSVELRRTLMKVVREQARAKKLHWRKVFHLVYLEFYERYGINLAAKAIAAGNGTRKVDIADMNGWLPKLIEIASNL